MTKGVESVGIVVLQKNRVLLVKSGPDSSHFIGKYGLPSGKIESGESPKQTAVRELLEETGLATQEEFLFPLKIFEATITQKHGTVHFIWHTFVCTSFTGNIRSTSETIPEWISIDKLKGVPNLLPNTESAVELGVQYKFKMYTDKK